MSLFNKSLNDASKLDDESKDIKMLNMFTYVIS